MAKGAPKGRPKPEGSGRQKGSLNKNTTDLKAMFFDALNEGQGGVAFLISQKYENPIAFMNLYGKFVPRDLVVEMDANMRITNVTHTIIDGTCTKDTESL
jgi:hypothetical protein